MTSRLISPIVNNQINQYHIDSHLFSAHCLEEQHEALELNALVPRFDNQSLLQLGYPSIV